MKTLIVILSAAMFFGCANGHYNTGSAATDAALTSATSTIAGQVAVVATKVAMGEDAKTALVQASGDALRSLEGVGITAIQPVITERLNKWVPHTPEWQNYAKSLATVVNTYVEHHGSTPSALQAALEAAALALNNF